MAESITGSPSTSSWARWSRSRRSASWTAYIMVISLVKVIDSSPCRPGLSAELAGLVVACRLPGDHVDPVEGVDDGDLRDQRGKLLVVVLRGCVGPDLV